MIPRSPLLVAGALTLIACGGHHAQRGGWGGGHAAPPSWGGGHAASSARSSWSGHPSAPAPRPASHAPSYAPPSYAPPPTSVATHAAAPAWAPPSTSHAAAPAPQVAPPRPPPRSTASPTAASGGDGDGSGPAWTLDLSGLEPVGEAPADARVEPPQPTCSLRCEPGFYCDGLASVCVPCPPEEALLGLAPPALECSAAAGPGGGPPTATVGQAAIGDASPGLPLAGPP